MKKTILISVVIAMTAFTATTFSGAFNSTKTETHSCKSEEIPDEIEFNTDCQGINDYELYMKIKKAVRSRTAFFI